MARPKETDPEKLKSRQERRRQWEQRWVKQYRADNPKKHLLWLAKARAKRKGLDFNLTEDDIVLSKVCPFLGITLQPTCRRGEKRGNIYTLDRIDNSKGYIKGNVEVISWQANTIKTNATKEELLAFAKEIIRRYGSGA